MSTATRKERKRELNRLRDLGAHDVARELRFEHPKKVGTPILERAIGPSLGANGRDYLSQHRSGRQLRKVAARLKVLDDSREQEEQRFRDDVQAQIAAEESLELDPKPYRVGRKRYSIYDVLNRFHQSEDASAEAVWSPRAKYAPDMSDYNHDGVVPPVESA